MPALTAAEARTAAGALIAAAARAERDAEGMATARAPLRAGRGAWLDGGLTRLAEAEDRWRAGASEMRAVAAQLEHAAGMLARAEGLMARLAALAQAAPGYGRLLSAVRNLVSLIDYRCARAVAAALGDGRLPDPPPPLDALELGVLHEEALSHNPRLARLAAEDPDYSFLPAAGGGLVAAVGDLDHAASVTTLVAGTGSTNPASWPGYLERGRALAAATGGAAVVWLDYPAPATVPAAAGGVPAAVAAPRLRAFQRSLARRNPAQRRIVVGHSYGALAVGAAARQPLAAHEAVLLAAPGAGASHATGLALRPGGRVHALTSRDDPIRFVTSPNGGVHGPDPTSPGFGARDWPAGPGGHSAYWDDSATLTAIGRIARGRGLE